MLAWLLALPPAENAPPPTGGDESGGPNYFMFIMLAVLVLFMFLPMLTQKKDKRRQGRVKELKKHDRVVTTGGIYGTIANIDDETVTLEVAKDVRMKLKRSSIFDLENGAEIDRQASEKKRQPASVKS